MFCVCPGSLKSGSGLKRYVIMRHTGRLPTSLDKANDTILQTLGTVALGEVVNPTRFMATKGTLIYSFNEYFVNTYFVPGVLAPGIQ